MNIPTSRVFMGGPLDGFSHYEQNPPDGYEIFMVQQSGHLATKNRKRWYFYSSRYAEDSVWWELAFFFDGDPSLLFPDCDDGKLYEITTSSWKDI